MPSTRSFTKMIEYRRWSSSKDGQYPFFQQFQRIQHVQVARPEDDRGANDQERNRRHVPQRVFSHPFAAAVSRYRIRRHIFGQRVVTAGRSGCGQGGYKDYLSQSLQPLELLQEGLCPLEIDMRELRRGNRLGQSRQMENQFRFLRKRVAGEKVPTDDPDSVLKSGLFQPGGIPDQGENSVLADKRFHQMAADESGAAGDQNFHACNSMKARQNMQ